jgi:hypothetical protein
MWIGAQIWEPSRSGFTIAASSIMPRSTRRFRRWRTVDSGRPSGAAILDRGLRAFSWGARMIRTSIGGQPGQRHGYLPGRVDGAATRPISPDPPVTPAQVADAANLA